VTWWATGTNSELVFTNLATITGPATQGEYLTIQASSGGTVSFPLLTSITKPSDGSTTANSGVQLNADSSGAISAPVLASFRDNDAGPRSSITRGTTGVLALPSLIASGTLGVTLSGTALPATAAPLINTPTAKNFTASGATLGGNVSGDGGTSITERGVVFSVSTSNSNPVIGGSGVTKVTATGTTGSFTAAVTGLTQATRYSYKAYAINGLGTNYTNVDTFTTLSSDANLNWLTLSHGALNPNFSSGTTSYTANVANAVSSITITPSTSQANAAVAVRVNGGTFASVSNGNASGALSLKVGANTVEVRVTAQDGVTQKTYTVTVNRLIPPTVTAPTATNITATGATLGGNVTSDGGSTITERGIVIATTATNVDPVINGTGVTKIPTTGTTGIFTLAVIQMTPETGYSYKAYAINGGGVSYSPVADFTTPSNNADLSNLALSSGSLSPVFASGTTTYTTAVPNTASSINVTATAAHANAAIQARVNGGTYASVTSGNASGALPLNVGSNTVEVRVTAQAGNTKTYTVTLTRAASLAAPTVTAPTATSITATGATLSGNVTSDNGAAITERGVVYSVTATNSNPLIGGTGVTKVTATGTIGGFTVQVSGLTQGGSYSYRAYAISSQGTAYTSVATFTVAAGWRGTQLTTVPNAADGIRNGAVHSSWYLYYYKGTDSNVWCTYWTGTQWTQVQLTSDANVDDWLTFGTPWNLLCYKGKDNKLWALYWSGAAWVTVALGTNTTVAGDVVIDDGWNIIYYRGSDSRVWAVQWNGVRWTHTSLGGTATVRGSLAVDDKNHLVYYRGNDNQVWCYSWTGTVWVQVRLTTTANVGGAVAADKAGGLAYYRSAADNSAWCTYWTGTVWSQVQLDAQAGMSAGNSIAPYGPYVTLYLTSGGQCAVEYWNGTAWGNVLLGDGGAGLTGGLSLHPATKWVFARRSDGQVVVFYYQ
jgi:hypothetical protein